MNGPIGDVLRSAKWLPAMACGEEALSTSGNLLARVAELWRGADPPTPANDDRSRRLARWTEWMDRQLAAGAQLTFDLPPRIKDSQRVRADSGLTGRLCWWPRGIPDGQWVAIISSRLGRTLDQRPEWFDAFRAACAKIDTDHSVLLTAAQTTTARFAERAAELFDLPTLVVHEPRSGECLLNWLRTIRKRPSSRKATFLNEAFLSPPLIPPGPQPTDAPAILPFGDRVVMDWADQVFVIHLRRGGNLEPLIRARLLASQRSALDVFVALGPRLVPRQLAEDLLGLGAVGWLLRPPCNQEWLAPCTGLNEECSIADSGAPIAAKIAAKKDSGGRRIVSLDAFISDRVDCKWEFLTHCTRRPPGPWPEQSNQEFLDELLTQRHLAERTPLMALLRIVTQQRILASAAALRGGTPAVCFTAVPLAELHRLRVFQPHRQCWDFEPYGICVQRDWLVAHGTRAVLYGDEEDWTQLSAADRPFFQRQETRRSGRRRDWTHECEWRHLGDVDLSLVSADDAMLFVPTADEAEQLTLASRWPIAICR
jgi:hypothetical protein